MHLNGILYGFVRMACDTFWLTCCYTLLSLKQAADQDLDDVQADFDAMQVP